MKPQKIKNKKMADFFEQEAELTSEDEWVGSGDEDEAGLDRMEREEGDDEVFNQKQLQRELGQIHMYVFVLFRLSKATRFRCNKNGLPIRMRTGQSIKITIVSLKPRSANYLK